MKTEHNDSLAKALALIEQTVTGEDRALMESSLSSVSCDVVELFAAELRARRERLRHWISLLSEEMRLSGGLMPVVYESRHKCSGPRSPRRAKRQLGAQRHSEAG